MPSTVANQKLVIIHRDMPKYDFLQIQNAHWMEFNKKYGPFALQVYLYLAKNADNYPLALSQVAAEKEAGIAKTTFHKYINLLIDEGYLVWKKGNVYDFYETPHKQEEKETECPPCGESLSPWEEQKNLSGERRSSSDSVKSPPHDIEINKRYINNTDMKKHLNPFVKEGLRGDTEDGFIF